MTTYEAMYLGLVTAAVTVFGLTLAVQSWRQGTK